MNALSPATNVGSLLVVDDQESNIQVVGAALGKLGFEILPATGGLQVSQRLAVRRPDLILLDLLMPDMDGFEVSTGSLSRAHPGRITTAHRFRTAAEFQ